MLVAETTILLTVVKGSGEQVGGYFIKYGTGVGNKILDIERLTLINSTLHVPFFRTNVDEESRSLVFVIFDSVGTMTFLFILLLKKKKNLV